MSLLYSIINQRLFYDEQMLNESYCFNVNIIRTEIYSARQMIKIIIKQLFGSYSLRYCLQNIINIIFSSGFLQSMFSVSIE